MLLPVPWSSLGFDGELSIRNSTDNGVKNMIYLFNSPVGTFTIRSTENGLFETYVNETLLATYQTPEAAALDVSLHATGWNAWDVLPGGAEPANLCEWQNVAEAHVRKPGAAPADLQRRNQRIKELSLRP